MALVSACDRLMLDPSFVLSREGGEWLEEDPEALEGTLIPQTFHAALYSAAPSEELDAFVAAGDRDALEERRDRLSWYLRGARTFSFEQAQLAEPDRLVLRELTEHGDTVSLIAADEWAFLQAHSTLISKVHLPLDLFREAGAAVVEYGRRLRQEMIDVVIPAGGSRPELTRRVLGTAAAKWLVIGGVGAAGSALGPVGGVAGSGIAVPVVRAFDP